MSHVGEFVTHLKECMVPTTRSKQEDGHCPPLQTAIIRTSHTHIHEEPNCMKNQEGL